MSDRSDPARVEELLHRQDELQAEAERVAADLELFGVLGRAGTVRLIGSAATGLMVWRDLDLQILSPGLTAGDAWDVVRPLAAHQRVYEVRFVDQSGTGDLNVTRRDRRYYVQLYYRADRGHEWKLDVSFWLSGDPREDETAYTERLARRLDPEARFAILWIKGLWVESPRHRDPAYGREVSSMDIYEAVLEHRVRSPEEFDAYLAARGKPARSSGRTGAA